MAKAPGFGLGWHADESMNAIDPPDPADIQGHATLGTPAVMNIYLRPEADLKGVVVDENGKPVAGVQVALNDIMLMDERGMETTVGINMKAEDWPEGLGRASTGPDGRFRLPGLPSESCCWLFFERPGAKSLNALYASTLAEARSHHGKPEHRNSREPHELYPRDMTVAMPTTRTVEVRVVADDDGQPVPKAHVDIIGESLATGVAAYGDSDAGGLVTLDLPAGKYKGLDAAPDSTSSRFIRTYLKAFEVAAGPQVQRFELRMKPGVELLMEAVDEATGRGVPGIHFEIRSEKGTDDWTALRGEEKTAADGKLRALISPTPGKTYRVRVLGAERGDPDVPPPPPLTGDGLPYDVSPNMSDPFEAAPGRSIPLRFSLKKR